MSDELTELPESWHWVKISEITHSMQNGIYKAAQFYDDNGIACLRMYNIENGEIVWKEIKRMILTEVEVEQYQLKSGDILINRVNSRELVGKAAVIPPNFETCVYESKNIRLRLFQEFIQSKFVNYWFRVYSQKYFNQNAQQTVGMASINQEQIGSMPMPIPPINEQKRIVAKIEELRDRHQRAKQALETIPELCDRFRQSVLAAAFRGDLTADWREQNPDVEPASVLLERVRVERFNNWERNENRRASLKGTQFEKVKSKKYTEPVTADASIEITKPESWLLVAADQITFLITDGKHGDCRDEPNSGYFFLSVKDLHEGKLHYENARQIQEQDFQEVHYRTNLEIGDVLVTNAGTIGRVAVARDLDKVERTTFQKSIAILKLVKEVVQPDYLAMYIENNVSHLNEKSSGTAVKNLLLRDLKKFTITLPPIEEQKEIVRRVEELLAFADRLGTSYSNVCTQFDRLNQSILTKAFRGELVEQDPNDEPASVLLDRIRAEREKLSKSTKGRGRGSKASKGASEQMTLPDTE